MPYKKIDLTLLPPMIIKDTKLDYQGLNAMIKHVFSTTPVKKEHTCDSYATKTDIIWLDSSTIREIKSVRIYNRIGPEISYTEDLKTGQYCNKIKLNRALMDGEQIVVEYYKDPTFSDILRDDKDSVYLNVEIYNKLIENLYTYAKNMKQQVSQPDKK